LSWRRLRTTASDEQSEDDGRKNLYA
jgi:hypothetical protein